MAFEVSYNLENEQQFWDGGSASTPPVAPTMTDALHRARRYRIDSLPGSRGHRQLPAILSECYDQLQMYVVSTCGSPLIFTNGKQPITFKPITPLPSAYFACLRETCLLHTENMCAGR